MSATSENALLLLAEIRAALARGTNHYDVRGNLLTNEKQIIEAMLADGKIAFEPRKQS